MSRPARLTVAALLALASLNSSASLTGGQRAHAQDLTGLARIDATNSAVTEEGDGIALRLSLSQGVPWRVFTLADPPRLVFDFREIDWAGLDGAALIGTERVADLRFGSYRPGWSRLVLTLTDPMPVRRAQMRIAADTGRATVTARLGAPDPVGFAAAAGAPADPAWDLPKPALPPRKTGAKRPLTVVIDPGHGGIDPGAIHDRMTEKSLMLTLARAVREALVREGDTRVVLTRDDDSFVPLERRVSIAHEVGADLFISLHADILPFGNAHGATIYTLSETASDEASEKLSERHDRDDLLSGVDLTGKDDVVAGVLLDLARQETTPRTRAFSDALQAAIGESGVPLNSRPQRMANFSVLKAADIPSVLIEVGYLSSDRDRGNLADPAFLGKVAEAIRDAVLAWTRADAALRPLIRQ